MIQENTPLDKKAAGDVVISLSEVSKTYRLYPSHQDRLKEALHPFRKRYHKEFSALNGVTIDIHRGESVGILGRNGAGKSTLLQLIAGVISPTSGTINVAGKVAALLELGAGFNPDLTGRENVILASTIQGVAEKEIAERVTLIEIFADIGIFFDQPMKIYSSGMYARVAFANAIHVNPDLLIVDEILGVGDAKFQEKCYRKLEELRTNGVSILFVSHSVSTILTVCDRCMLLDKGEVCLIGKAKDAVDAYHALLYSPPSKASGQDKPANLASTPGLSPAYGIPPKQPTSISSHPVVDLLLEDNAFIERISTRRSYNKGHFRTGNRQAQILDYVIVSGKDTDAQMIRRGATVDIYLKILYNDDVPRPVVGMAINKMDGVCVYGTSTQLMSINLMPGKSKQFRVYRFRFLNNVAGGDFFLNLGISTLQENGQILILDNLRSVAHLVFERTPESAGLISLQCTIEEIGVTQKEDGGLLQS